MDKTSTTMTNEKSRLQKTNAPSSRTIEFIRQFARVYMPVGKMPGLVLN